MAVVRHFISEAIKRTEINEFLQKKLERSGYGGVVISKTPLGTHVVIYTMRPGLVIGRGGGMIKELAKTLEDVFHLPNPQISVSEIEFPELNAHIMGTRIASALQRGVHFRRAGFWALHQIMEADAIGAEIIISGKLRTDRARYEKFRSGYLPKCGNIVTTQIQKAEIHANLKPGTLGIRVRILPPNVVLPDANVKKTEKEEDSNLENSDLNQSSNEEVKEKPEEKEAKGEE
jgi:small subunit ribosomal protein S3